MDKAPGKRWMRLSAGDDAHELGMLSRLIGQPVVEVDRPKYLPDVFQVWCREDGLWIHAMLCRRLQRRKFYKWIASCG